jgi:hypothetical protein
MNDNQYTQTFYAELYALRKGIQERPKQINEEIQLINPAYEFRMQ